MVQELLIVVASHCGAQPLEQVASVVAVYWLNRQGNPQLSMWNQGSDHVPCIGMRALNHWNIKEVLPSVLLSKSLELYHR